MSTAEQLGPPLPPPEGEALVLRLVTVPAQYMYPQANEQLVLPFERLVAITPFSKEANDAAFVKAALKRAQEINARTSPSQSPAIGWGASKKLEIDND